MDKIREQWRSMLKLMLEECRETNPDDPRSDTEILHSIMEYFVEVGIIEKVDGKYNISELVYDA